MQVIEAKGPSVVSREGSLDLLPMDSTSNVALISEPMAAVRFNSVSMIDMTITVLDIPRIPGTLDLGAILSDLAAG